MALVNMHWRPSRKELRIFALLQLAFFLIVAWLLHQRLGYTSIAVGLSCLSGVLAGLGLIWPAAVRPVYVLWMTLAFPIGWVISHLLMAVMFYVVITCVGQLMRFSGRDPLERTFDRDAKTYWKRREPTKGTRNYFRQY